MAGSVNKVILVGTIGKYGCTLRYAPSGTACTSFTLVLTDQTQDGKYFSTLVPCEVWGKKAEACSELEPGQLVCFEGKIVRRKGKEERYEWVVSGYDLTPIVQPVEVGRG